MQSQFALGDTLAFSESFSDYPASAGWILHYRLLPSGDEGEAVTFDASANGDGFDVSVPAATTAAWLPGAYSYVAWVTSGALSHTVEQGRTQLSPNPRTYTGALDVRTAAETALDAVRQTIRGTATQAVLRYKINGRELERYSITELIALESKLKNDVRSERDNQRSSGTPSSRKVMVQIGRA